MKKLVILIALLFSANSLFGQENTQGLNNKSEPQQIKTVKKNQTDSDNSIAILWTTAERDVFTKVVFMYALNSKKLKWWEEVELIVWGPSSKLLAEDEELHVKIKELKEAGVSLVACKWCSDQYEVSDILKDLGIEIKYMGRPLTEYLKSKRHVLVF